MQNNPPNQAYSNQTEISRDKIIAQEISNLDNKRNSAIRPLITAAVFLQALKSAASAYSMRLLEQDGENINDNEITMSVNFATDVISLGLILAAGYVNEKYSSKIKESKAKIGPVNVNSVKQEGAPSNIAVELSLRPPAVNTATQPPTPPVPPSSPPPYGYGLRPASPPQYLQGMPPASPPQNYAQYMPVASTTTIVTHKSPPPAEATPPSGSPQEAAAMPARAIQQVKFV